MRMAIGMEIGAIGITGSSLSTVSAFHFSILTTAAIIRTTIIRTVIRMATIPMAIHLITRFTKGARYTATTAPTAMMPLTTTVPDTTTIVGHTVAAEPTVRWLRKSNAPWPATVFTKARSMGSWARERLTQFE